MIKKITSSDNSVLKLARKLKNKGERNKTGLFIAEGKRIVEDALDCELVKNVITTDACFEFENTYLIDRRLYEKISDTLSPQGVMAICEIPKRDICDISGNVVVCDGVKDPGNLGTIIRTAECAGFGAVLLINDCADPYNPKAVRSTMGSIFRLPVISCKTEDILKLKDYTLAVTMLDGAVDIYKAEFKGKTALVIGSEANGVSNIMKQNAQLPIKIPMCGKAESINAAVAAGIAMYAVKKALE